MASMSLVKAKKQIESLKQSSKRARAKAGEMTESLLTTGEVAGTAFAIGFWEGRIDNAKQFEIFSVPVPLAMGVGAHVFALLGVGRGMEGHLRSIGNGALAAHLNGIGRRLGQEAKTTKVTSGVEMLGEGSKNSGIGITEEDLIYAAR